MEKLTKRLLMREFTKPEDVSGNRPQKLNRLDNETIAY